MTNEDGVACHRLPPARFALSLTTLILMLCGMRAALAAEPTKHFNLPAQDLISAMLGFGRQSGMQILFGTDASERKNVGAIRTGSVVGDFTAREALTRMLEGTGLQFRFTAADKIVLFLVSTPVQPDAVPSAQPHSSTTEVEPTVHVPPIDEMYVTGSRLRGALDVVSPTVIMPNRELRRSTFATVQDSLYVLPMSSLSGPREDWGTAGNTGFGAGINLRHLGAGATLVLVNGYRQPASGEELSFTDVSSVPWSAVDRIEIVPDGSSSVYGSDAIAGVVNIIMREDLNGAESHARFTSVPGGANELQASQLIGKRWTSGHALLAYQYSERAPLAAADRAYAANADKRPLGGTDHRTYYAGNVIDPATLQPVLGIPSTGVRTASDYSAAINLANDFEQVQLLPEREAHNVFFTITQSLSERWSIRADGRYGVRDASREALPATQILFVPQSNPFYVDPFPDQPAPGAFVAYSFLKGFGGPLTTISTTRVLTGAVSATASLGRDWQLALSHFQGREDLRISLANMQNPAAVFEALNQTDPARAFNPFGRTSPQVIEAIRDTLSKSALSEIRTTSAAADGTLWHLATGPAKLAIGAEYRGEAFGYANSWGIDIQNQRYVGSTFAEASVPLVANPRDPRAAPRLEFTVAARLENYSDFGRTFNPRLGLKWAPVDEFKVRASWGKSFRAPTLVDRDTSRNLSGIVSLEDPKSPTGRSVIVGIQGNNPNIREETAATWTTGFDFVPTVVPGLELSLTYFDVDYGDRIVVPARNGPLEILLHEEQWASVINRHPTQAQIDAICQRPDFLGPGTCAEAGPSIIIDYRKTNLSETKVRGLDVDIKRKWESRIGSWNLELMGSYIFEFGQRNSTAAPIVDVLNTVGNPPALKLRAVGGWSQYRAAASGLGATAAINYTNGFRDIESAFTRKVQPWTTVDLQLSYRSPATSGWPAGLDLMLNAVNVLNTPPPFVDRPDGYDFANAQPIGRTISLEVRKSW
jgi:iron complex outermembrane recepter protein